MKARWQLLGGNLSTKLDCPQRKDLPIVIRGSAGRRAPPPTMRVLPLDLEYAAMPTPPAGRSRLRRLFSFGRPAEEQTDLVGSVCLDRLVRNFMEDVGESCRDSAADDDAAGDGIGVVRGLVLLASLGEKALMADAAAIVEKSRSGGGSCNESTRRMVVDGLVALGYEASICRTSWERSATMPAGGHEFVGVELEGEGKAIVEVDFRSEFEIARPTKAYVEMLQLLPPVFVGKPERLRQIVAAATQAARISLKKKGLHVPPWRRCEYMTAKWLSTPSAAAGGAKLPALARERERTASVSVD